MCIRDRLETADLDVELEEDQEADGVGGDGEDLQAQGRVPPVSYTHLTLPTSDLV